MRRNWRDLSESGKQKRRRAAARDLLAASERRLDEVVDKWRERGVFCTGRSRAASERLSTTVFYDGDGLTWFARWRGRSVELTELELPF